MCSSDLTSLDFKNYFIKSSNPGRTINELVSNIPCYYAIYNDNLIAVKLPINIDSEIFKTHDCVLEYYETKYDKGISK